MGSNPSNRYAMYVTCHDKPMDPLFEALQPGLLHRYGPVIGRDELSQALGYASGDGFRQALARGLAPVPVFAIPHRGGKYALTKDVASWLAELSSERPRRRQHESASSAPWATLVCLDNSGHERTGADCPWRTSQGTMEESTMSE